MNDVAPTDELVEKVAEAIHTAEREWASGTAATRRGVAWEDCHEITRTMRRVTARAAIAAIAGTAVQ